MSRKLTINSEFEALGCFYKIVNVNFKTGICRIQASITQRHEDFEYAVHIGSERTYTQGDAARMVAAATMDNKIVTNPTLTWSSSNPEVISIDENGNALFVGLGTCAISCLWKEHNAIDTIYVEVVAAQTSLICEIDGPDDVYLNDETTYTAIFYTADGVTKDKSITPVWTLDLPKELNGKVNIVKKSGNTITLKAYNGTQGECFGLMLTDSSGQYNTAKTINIRSWF